jgi:hypothetical protein
MSMRKEGLALLAMSPFLFAYFRPFSLADLVLHYHDNGRCAAPARGPDRRSPQTGVASLSGRLNSPSDERYRSATRR